MNVRRNAGRNPWFHGGAAYFSLQPARKSQSAFTLIELILVMVIITVAVSLAAPRLSAFFRGRALDSEARRMLALTRYAQDRAASEGVPIRMWFDPQNREYGIRPDQTYEQENTDDLRFKLGDGVSLRVQAQVTRSSGQSIARRLSTTSMNSPGSTQNRQDNFDAIRFLPDGLIDPESTLSITITDADNYSLIVAPADNRMHFEITRGGTR